MSTLPKLPVHVVIPDTQAKPGVPTDHLRWIGQYIVDHFAGREHVKIIHLGDHYDMPSLSSYDKKGSKSMEQRRVLDDLNAGDDALDELDRPLIEYNGRQRETKHAQWLPEKYVLLGNHEDRISRAIENDPQMDGVLSLDKLKFRENGWQVQPYLDPLFLDGIGYAHYWYNPMTGKPLGGMASTRLKTLGHSFTMGHQQTFDYALRYVADETGFVRGQHALIAGACYLHDEDYKGYQGNAHWRGIVVKHQVSHGDYDIMKVSLDYLCQRYEGETLATWLPKHYESPYTRYANAEAAA